MKIYIAGPYTKGDLMTNIRRAIQVGENLANIGHIPFIPHLTAFWHMVTPHDDVDFWYAYDNEWLRVCDAVFRFSGESVGADKEVELARELGLPIYYSIWDVPVVLEDK